MLELNYYEKEYGKISLLNMINIYDVKMLLCNNIINLDGDIEWEDYSLIYDEEEDYYYEIYQYFLIGERDKDLFVRLEYPVGYIKLLDLWVVGITHYGTGWDYILTDVPIDDYKNWFNIEEKEYTSYCI